MKKISVLLFFVFTVIQLRCQDNSFRNPVLPGFYPDPSVCRNGDDYYLVTSSFQYFPGVPVFHSNDLIHWKQVGHCLTEKSQLPLDGATSSGGIYAPTIRYQDGVYYMVTTNVTGGGNFYVTTTNLAGKWSDPIRVKQGGIDPTIFFDDNGDVYFTSTVNSGIALSRLDIKTGKLLSDIKTIWKGTGGRYPEAPHIYKINGWYYLMIAEGGTEYGHMETIARSRSIWGPYESNPENPILTHRNYSGMFSPIQGTGHADLIQAHDGSWWMVFLGFRPAGGTFHHLGRETFLMPVKWNKEGWPYINENDTASLLVKGRTLPFKKNKPEPARDDFNGSELNFAWNFLRNPNAENYSLKEKSGFLALHGTGLSLNDAASPAFIGRRQQHFSFSASAALDFKAQKGEEGGITVFMDEKHHYDLFLTRENEKYYVILRYIIGSINHIQKKLQVPGPEVVLSVSAKPEFYSFQVKKNEKANPDEMGTVETRYLSSEVAGGFTGVYVGLYSTGNGRQCLNPVFFDWFDYSGEDK